MTNQMIVRLNPDVKRNLSRVSRHEGKSSSEVVRALIDGYIREHDIGSYVDGLWERIGSKLSRKGFRSRDAERLISAVRRKAS